MKRIGLIGGVGPESTIVYYRLINQRYREQSATKEYPTLLINSINMSRMLALIARGQWSELIDFLYREIKTLEDAGVSHAAITSNTPHIVFNELQEKARIKLISIVEESCQFVKSQGLKRIGLLGTKSTMAGGFYNREAEKQGIELVLPDAAPQEYIHDKYMNELIFNHIRPETKEELIRIVTRLKTETGMQGLILGGTELPLILSQDDFEDISIFDLASIHVDSIVKAMISE